MTDGHWGESEIVLVENAVEAGLLMGILIERGISHRVECMHDAAYDGVYQQQMGWGRIIVDKVNLPEVMELLREVRRGAEYETDNV